MGFNSIGEHISNYSVILDNYLKEKEWSSFGEVIKNNYQETLNTLNVTGVDNILKQRAISMLYLDKMATTHGKLHPDFKFVKEGFDGGYDFLASLELINVLNHIKVDNRFPAEALELIDRWVMGEMTTLPLIAIMEYFQNFSTQDFEPSSNNLTLAELRNEQRMFVESGKQKALNPDEVEMIANMIVEELKKLNPGDIFKIPAGFLGHSTRIIIQRNLGNGDYTLLHSNTGGGKIQIESPPGVFTPSTLTEYRFSFYHHLEKPEFWKSFLYGITQADMEDINNLFAASKEDLGEGFIKAAKDQKSAQEMGTCTFKSIENDLKYFIISHASNREIGFQIYKLIKSLMISKSKECLHQSIHPYLKDMLVEKELVRKRYFNWISICNNTQQFQEVKEAYFAAISDLLSEKNEDINPILEKINNNLKDLTNLHVLKYLDRYADELAKETPRNTLEEVRNKYSTQMTFEGTNYLCLRPSLWLKNNSDLLDEILTDKNIKRQFFKVLIQASKIFLPGYITKEVENELYVRDMKKEDLLNLLKEYAQRQDPSIVVKQLREGISNQKFLFSELIHLENTVTEAFAANVDIDFLQKNFLSNPLDVPSIKFFNEKISTLRRQQEAGQSCSLFADHQLEKILELLAKTEVPEVKAMLQNLLDGVAIERVNAVAIERVKGLLHSGNLVQALEIAYGNQCVLEFIVDTYEKEGSLDALNAYIEGCKKELLKSEFIADMGMIYLKKGRDKQALEFVDGIKKPEQASKLLAAIVEHYISNGDIDLAKTHLSKEILVEQDYAEVNKKMGMYFGSQKNWKEMERCLSNVPSQEVDNIFLQFENAFIKDAGFIAGIGWIEKINNPKIKQSAVMALIENGKKFDFSDEEIDEIIIQFKAMQNDDDTDKLLDLFGEMLFNKQKCSASIRVINQRDSDSKYQRISNCLLRYSRDKFNGDDAVKIFEVLKELSEGERNYFALFFVKNLIEQNFSKAQKLVELVRTLKFEKPSEAQREEEYFFFSVENSLVMLGIIKQLRIDRNYFAQYFLESILRCDQAEAKKFAETAKKDLNIQFDENTLQMLEK